MDLIVKVKTNGVNDSSNNGEEVKRANNENNADLRSSRYACGQIARLDRDPGEQTRNPGMPGPRIYPIQQEHQPAQSVLSTTCSTKHILQQSRRAVVPDAASHGGRRGR